MEIIKNSNNSTKVDLFRMTQGKEVISVKDVADGTDFVATHYCEYKDIDHKGTEKVIFAFISDNKVYATVSETFKTSFYNMLDLFDGKSDSFKFHKISGITKNDKPYVDCDLTIEETKKK